jgi:hypothetical protein
LCFDDLASGTALAVGLPAQRAITTIAFDDSGLRRLEINT